MQTNPSLAYIPVLCICHSSPLALITKGQVPDSCCAQSPLELFKLANPKFAQLPHLFLSSETTIKPVALNPPDLSHDQRPP